MAQFCTKCGAPIGEGMPFCTSCGAPSAAPSAPAAQAPPSAPAVTSTPAETAALAPGPAVGAPPPKKGSPVVKILLIVVAVIIFFTLLIAASCAYMFYRAKQKVRQFRNQVESSLPSHMGTREVFPIPSNPPENPGGAPEPGSSPAVNMADLAYPGATAGESTNQNLFGKAGIKLQEYFTSDSVDTVLAFYKNKLGNNAMVTQSGENAVIQVGGGGGYTTIHIAPDSSSGKTKISISSITKQ